MTFSASRRGSLRGMAGGKCVPWAEVMELEDVLRAGGLHHQDRLLLHGWRKEVDELEGVRLLRLTENHFFHIIYIIGVNVYYQRAQIANIMRDEEKHRATSSRRSAASIN